MEGRVWRGQLKGFSLKCPTFFVPQAPQFPALISLSPPPSSSLSHPSEYSTATLYCTFPKGKREHIGDHFGAKNEENILSNKKREWERKKYVCVCGGWGGGIFPACCIILTISQSHHSMFGTFEELTTWSSFSFPLSTKVEYGRCEKNDTERFEPVMTEPKKNYARTEM